MQTPRNDLQGPWDYPASSLRRGSRSTCTAISSLATSYKEVIDVYKRGDRR